MSRELVESARRLITSKDTALSTVRLQPGSFQRPGSFSTVRTNARERRIPVTFQTANAPTLVYHGLGFAPSGFTVLAKDRAADVYSTLPMSSTSRVIVLYCNTAGTTADILVR
jgi:hypothetical protein